ncbi:3-oxoadipate enol-lactonase / 4-carboxymuconolactone decarboxylase [Nocardiopsis flavescens]|uniref:3-oxoadipate enol-lactonase / 4-carboxymuconolactone decarboxylase n=1 Tax=Nocardiopsis flavescens TaxID=758803 RepID=A0A1M6CUU1_9ACTN|nr:4-carboxymuconolactone decarboxylase [Nocardiopsis flavescens]SHI64611.1 3-oxoadipate enol-lactonase / 4-carboxymuconolactone decarboxylase [Nocardiopsis flavescens]
MTVPRITGVELAGGPDRPLLLAGPSLGTSAAALWSAAADRLGDAFHVVGWNLPGHGGAPTADAPFTVEELARGVLGFARGVTAARGGADRSFRYAGVSLGGAVGLHLLLDAPEAVRSAALLCTGARIGEPGAWRERAATVRASGTAAVVEGSARRWFAPGFAGREPTTAAALLHALRDTDAGGYALACGALAGFDVRDRLGEVTAPVLAVAGARDGATPPASLEALARGVRRGRAEVLAGVAHLAPAEAPDRVAALLRAHFADPGSPPDASRAVGPPTGTGVGAPTAPPSGPHTRRGSGEDPDEDFAAGPGTGPPTDPGADGNLDTDIHPGAGAPTGPPTGPGTGARLAPDTGRHPGASAGDGPGAGTGPGALTQEQVHAAGMAVRREVLGDAHVDRAVAATTDFTAGFQDFITRYAWGTVWTRPGLDRRSRSMITLTALIARGHHEEFAMHVRAALRNGLTPAEIEEVVLQSAVYCGVPDANTAFRIAQRVLSEPGPA